MRCAHEGSRSALGHPWPRRLGDIVSPQTPEPSLRRLRLYPDASVELFEFGTLRLRSYVRCAHEGSRSALGHPWPRRLGDIGSPQTPEPSLRRLRLYPDASVELLEFGTLRLRSYVRCAHEGSRTPDPQLRRLLLYPAELRAPFGMIGFEPTTPCSQSKCATTALHPGLTAKQATESPCQLHRCIPV